MIMIPFTYSVSRDPSIDAYTVFGSWIQNDYSEMSIMIFKSFHDM